jgi:hypothetical protein
MKQAFVYAVALVLAVGILVAECQGQTSEPHDAASVTHEQIQEAQRHVFERMTTTEKTMLVRCQLCHDISDAITAFVQTTKLTKDASTTPSDAAKLVVADACSIVQVALSEGGTIFKQRGPQYGEAALALAKETCALLMEEIAPLYENYVDSLLDLVAAAPAEDNGGISLPPSPCDAVCPGAQQKAKQHDQLAAALKRIKEREAFGEQEEDNDFGASHTNVRQRPSASKRSDASSTLVDALLVVGLMVVGWVSLKAYRLAAATRPSPRSGRKQQAGRR